jgi:hypothetical protein
LQKTSGAPTLCAVSQGQRRARFGVVDRSTIPPTHQGAR